MPGGGGQQRCSPLPPGTNPRKQTTMTTHIKITMSERAPLRIALADWPVVAEARGYDNQHEFQANHKWFLKVREHADGRRIVYGAYEAGNGGVHAGFRALFGGFLVEPTEEFRDCGEGPLGHVPDELETIRAIRRVEGIICVEGIGDDCIADLPAQELA